MSQIRTPHNYTLNELVEVAAEAARQAGLEASTLPGVEDEPYLCVHRPLHKMAYYLTPKGGFACANAAFLLLAALEERGWTWTLGPEECRIVGHGKQGRYRCPFLWQAVLRGFIWAMTEGELARLHSLAPSEAKRPSEIM